MEVDLTVFLALVALLVLIGLTLFGFWKGRRRRGERCTGLGVYSGLNYVATVSTGPPPIPAAQIAYKFIKVRRKLEGPYGGAAVGAAFTELTSIAPGAAVLGIFYDNPQAVEESRLRCAVGCVVDAADRQPLAQDTKDLLAKNDYKLMNLPGISSAVNSSFPHRTPLSIRLAPLRVYPALTQYIEEKELCAYPMLEVYGEAEIRFMVPLSKQEEFFVPEACEEDSSEPEDLAPSAVPSASQESQDEDSQSDADDADDADDAEDNDADDFEQVELPAKEEATSA